ncbi:MAG TPA: HAMP domain-containing sensor histidine kinase, partial [Kofleriaceae bacterium]|nr:HAMP domain-containing sensor histidine kinase [Kofleriaceae bacterium]
RAGEAGATAELLDTARIGVDQLAETVDEILDVARVEAGELRLACEPVDVRRLVDDSLARWRGRAADRAVRIEVRGGGAGPVLADRGRLRIVLDNLVDNAIKYSPGDGVIEIEVAPADGPPRAAGGAARAERIAVTVRDHGPGIPPEFRRRVFDKFFRVEDHRRRPGDAPHGTGIGLYLCRALVELHGGTIDCDAPPGGGARLRVEIPTSLHNTAS